MTETSQAAFLATIKKALNRPAGDRCSLQDIIQTDPAPDDSHCLAQIRNRDKAARRALLETLAAAGKPLNMTVSAMQDAPAITAAIADLAAGRQSEWGDAKTVVAWDHPLVENLALAASLEPLQVPVYFPGMLSAANRLEAFRDRAASALIGVTAADYCVAATATLMMKSRIGQPRCTSLLPSIHVAIIRLEQILANLKELYTLLKWDPAEQREGLTECLTFISGPSKTADIEATLVHGAHGPRELHLFVLTG